MMWRRNIKLPIQRRNHADAVKRKSMTEKELLKLKRSEMLEIMLAQSREIDELRKELEETKAQLEDKKIKVRKAGSLAEASLQLTNIFVEAQKAADLYVENIKRRALQKEAAYLREKTEKTPEAGDESIPVAGDQIHKETRKETHHEPAAGRENGEAEQNE